MIQQLHDQAFWNSRFIKSTLETSMLVEKDVTDRMNADYYENTDAYRYHVA